MISAKVLALRTAAWDSDEVEDAAGTRQILDLYDSEQVSLRRYLMYRGVDGESAAEAVQESFLRLHQHLLAGGERTNLRAWLYRVAHNLGRNTQSAARVSRTIPLPEEGSPAVASDPGASAEEQLLAREKELQFRRALSSLSPAQRSCLALRSQGLKYREIAGALGLSTSTVAENVQRGLEKLKESL